MAYSDWNHYGQAESNNSLSTSTVYEGNASLYVADAGSETSPEILAQSETDSPTEGVVQTYAYPTVDPRTGPLAFFRYQDINNHYWLSFHYESNTYIGLYKVVNGNETQVERSSITNGELDFFNLSDGTQPYQNWHRYRFSFWVDAAGDLRGRLEEDADNDGTWTQLGNDVVDTSPSLGTGGGIGVGGRRKQEEVFTQGECVFDATKVYY